MCQRFVSVDGLESTLPHYSCQCNEKIQWSGKFLSELKKILDRRSKIRYAGGDGVGPPRDRSLSRAVLLEPNQSQGIADLRRRSSLHRVEDRARQTASPPSLGVRAKPVQRDVAIPWATRRGPAPSWFSRWGIDRFVTGVAPAHHSLRRVFNTCSSVVRNCPAITSRDSGMTRIWPTTLMKFVSPCHLGTRWAWRCSGTPAPAARP